MIMVINNPSLVGQPIPSSMLSVIPDGILHPLISSFSTMENLVLQNVTEAFDPPLISPFISQML